MQGWTADCNDARGDLVPTEPPMYVQYCVLSSDPKTVFRSCGASIPGLNDWNCTCDLGVELECAQWGTNEDDVPLEETQQKSQFLRFHMRHDSVRLAHDSVQLAERSQKRPPSPSLLLFACFNFLFWPCFQRSEISQSPPRLRSLRKSTCFLHVSCYHTCSPASSSHLPIHSFLVLSP